MTGSSSNTQRETNASHPLVIATAPAPLFGVPRARLPFAADGGFVIERYARNTAAGHELVYISGKQVSALTSPLYASIRAALASLGLAPAESYRLLAPSKTALLYHSSQ